MAGAAGAAASFATIGLAGCSDDTPGGPGDTPTELPRTGRPRYQGEIVVATLQNPSPAAQQALTKAYQQYQPDVDIRWETQDWPDKGLYATWLSAQLAAAPTRPDIISGEYEPGFSNYVNLEEYRWRTNPYTGNAWDKDFLFARVRDLDATGKRTTIGTETQHLSWYYNQKVFDDLKLEPPANWDELVTVCETISATGVTPLSVSLSDAVIPWFAPTYFDQYHTSWAGIVRAREGDWDWDPRRPEFVDDPDEQQLHVRYTFSPLRFYQALKDRRLRFDTPAVIEIMSNLGRIFPRYADSATLLSGDHYVPFLQGRAAMMVEASWALVQLDRDLDKLSAERANELNIDPGSVQRFEWGVFEFPPMVSSLASSIVRVPEPTVGYEIGVVGKGDEQTAMTMDFLMFWLSKPGFSAFLDAEQSSPGWVPEGFPLVTEVAYPDDVAKLQEKVRLTGNPIGVYSDFWVSGGGQATQDLRGLFGQAIQGRVAAPEFATQLQAYVQAHFTELLGHAGLTDGDLANPARRPATL
ncbi:hypothetical protein GCM10027569_90030 [Flindersiella endophytica]